MHADPALVHRVADLRRETLLREAAASVRDERGRQRLARAPAAARRIATHLSTAIGWLLTEFEARPCGTTGITTSPGPAAAP